MVANDIGTVRAPSRTARPSADEIDAAILDTAAEVFARHGFAGTSVQQVADAVGYSKTGLLRRFPSKQALYDAVVEHVSDQLGVLREQTVGARRPGGGAQIVRTAASAAFAHPGAVLLMLEAMRSVTDLPHADRLGELAHLLVQDLTLDLADGRDQLRAVLAVQLVANAALLTITPEAQAFGVTPAQVHDLAVELASDVLGAPGAP
ncbi:TetR/AcrR family transcriptional regulator [Jannaschia sp. R86511]|uniref:TetR/AcrR family transcriptional regulator n=1 Tax=Jannaschia sp. R86511 TaxID=3093853 RepID=UPI0036D41A9A